MSVALIAIVAGISVTALGIGGVLLAIHRSRTVGSRSLLSRDQLAVVKEARRRLAANPRDALALRSLADIHYAEGEYEQARRMYAALVELCATDKALDETALTIRHAMSSFQLKDYAEAYKGLMIARASKQDDFEVNATLGQLEYIRKNYKRAIGLLQPAVSVDGEHVPARRYLGLAMYRLKQFEGAAPHLSFAVDHDPADRDTIYALARSYDGAGSSARALKLFTHLRADPRLGPHSCLAAGSIHLNQQRYDEAIADYRIGLKHQDAPVKVALELRYRQATAHLRKGDVAAALGEWESIRAAAPAYRDVPALIKRYREIAANRHLQVFLVGRTPDFVNLCKQIALAYYADATTKLGNVAVVGDEYVDVVADVSTSSWDDQILFRFLRTSGDTGELVLRDMYAKLKKMRSGGRGVCASAGSYTTGAQSFVEARRIDLLGKEELVRKFQRLGAPQAAA